MKIMVAEDDPNTRTGLRKILESEGYAVVEAPDGRAALETYEQEQPDVVCLDIMMPELNGYDVCKQIRQRNETIPVLFISAKSEEIDTVIGLELGADDFITKPFGVKEVVARIRAVTRRYLLARKAEQQPTEEDMFTIGDLQVSPSELRAWRGDEVIDLSLRDVEILRLFADHAGKALDRNTIFNAAWGCDYFPNSRTLDQHISQLRKRIETDPKNPQIIATVHGVGYRYDPA
jgi:DNA-binding response OmpR family regulator